MPKYPNFKTESEDRGDGSVDEGLLSKHKEGPDFESKHWGKRWRWEDSWSRRYHAGAGNRTLGPLAEQWKPLTTEPPWGLVLIVNLMCSRAARKRVSVRNCWDCVSLQEHLWEISLIGLITSRKLTLNMGDTVSEAGPCTGWKGRAS